MSGEEDGFRFFLRHEKEGDGADDDNDDSDEDEHNGDCRRASEGIGVPAPQGQIFRDRGHRATAIAGLLIFCGLCSSSLVRISQPYV